MKNTREHIIEVSLLLFLQKSYRDVTMKEIVDKTGLSKGAFYHYFSSKEELFKEITKSFFTMGTVDYASFSNFSLKEFYHQYIEYLNASITQLSVLVDPTGEGKASLNIFLIMFEAINRFPEFLKLELEVYKRDMDNWVHIISIARFNGEIKSPSTDEDIARLFLYCTDGVFLRYVNNEKSASYKEYLSSVYNSIYDNLRV